MAYHETSVEVRFHVWAVHASSLFRRTVGISVQTRLIEMSEATQSSLTRTQQESDLQARFISDNMRRIFLQIYRIVGNVDDRAGSDAGSFH